MPAEPRKQLLLVALVEIVPLGLAMGSSFNLVDFTRYFPAVRLHLEMRRCI